MSGHRTRHGRNRAGFTILELMIAVSIVGVLAAIAIPAFLTYQLRTKTSEAKTNLSAIRTLENSYFTEYESYHLAAPEPAVIPGSTSGPFDDAGSDFAELGFKPEGNVYFSYGVGVSVDGVGFTADAGADIDANGFVQFWGYTKPDAANARVLGQVGCNPAGLAPDSVGPCTPADGRSVF
jgi:type IV pilus assembly protein PilA